MKSWTSRIVISVALALCMSCGVLAADIAPNLWQIQTGTWTVKGDVIVSETPSNTNTNAYMTFDQSANVMIYEWTVKYGETTVSFGPSAGMHFQAADYANSFRGVSYLAFQDQTYIRFYRTTGSALGKVAEWPTAEVKVGETHSYKVVQDTRSGLITIYRDGELVGSWTDPQPLKGAPYVSLRAGATVAEFSNIKITASN